MHETVLTVLRQPANESIDVECDPLRRAVLECCECEPPICRELRGRSGLGGFLRGDPGVGARIEDVERERTAI